MIVGQSQQLTQTKAQLWMLIAAGTTALFGFLHISDHVLRGRAYVLPVFGQVDTIWLGLATYLFVLPPLYLTARGRLLSGYWLFAGVVAAMLVGFGHLSPVAVEPVMTIYMDHASNPLAATISMTLLFSLFASSLALIITAVRVRLLTGSWR